MPEPLAQTGTPMLMDPSAVSSLEKSLAAIDSFEAVRSARAMAEPSAATDSFWPEPGSWLAPYRPYTVDNGTLTIPVRGYLANDLSYAIGAYATGYTYIRKAVERGLADEGVKRIGFYVSSGGGEVAGNFDLVDYIYEGRSQKPMFAVCPDIAASAAFSIASAAHRVWMTRTSVAGSVGVVAVHVEYSGMLEKSGIKVTLLHAGKHKVDGNAYEKLSAEVRERFETRLESLRVLFAETVARNFGLTVESVLETEALIYSAPEAVAIGFAHGIKTVDSALTDEANNQDEEEGEDNMSDPVKPEELAAANAKAIEDARTEGRAQGRAEGLTEGAAAERTRIKSILSSDAAKTRAEFAQHVALNTDLSVEAATELVAASPAPATIGATDTTPFATAMSTTENPSLGSQGDDEQAAGSDVSRILADFGAATGLVKK